MRRALPILLLLLVQPALAEHKEEAAKQADVEANQTLQILEQMRPPVGKALLESVPLGSVVRNYRFLMENASNEDVRAEAHKRLADINMDLSELRILVEVEGEDAASRIAGVPDLEYAGLDRGFDESIDLYKIIINDYPKYPAMDEVLYQLAKAYDLKGTPDLALQPLTRLVQEHKGSTFYAEAQFRRGELLFDEKDYADSEAAYSEVLGLGEMSPYFEQARYKRGWALFKRSDYQPALKDFFALLDRLPQGQFDQLDLPENERQLVEDTYRVIAMSFGYLVGEHSIKEFFVDFGRRPYEPSVYRSLGEHLMRQERYHDAATTYHQFSETHPKHPQSPLFQAGAVDAYRAGNFYALARPEMERFADVYGVESDYWKDAPAVIRAKILPHLRSYLPELAKYYHARAQDKKDPADYGRAADWYRGYLRAFGDEDDAPEINFLLADSLYEARKYDEAAVEYMRVAYLQDKTSEERRPDAGFAAITANQLYTKQLKGDAARDGHLKTAASGQQFVDWFPKDPRTTEVLALTAEELIAGGDGAKAVTTARALLDLDPPKKYEARAWKVTAHGAFESADYVLAESAAEKALDYVSRSDKEYPIFRERLAGAVYRQGEQARADGRLREAVGHFQRLADKVPESPFKINGRYDAGTVLLELKAWGEAITTLVDFRDDYPKHKLTKEVSIKLALAYEGNGQLDKAAAELQRVAQLEKESGVAAEAAWNAAELYERSGEKLRAIDQFKRYVEKYAQPLERNVEGRNRLAELYAGQKDEARQTYWLKQVVSGHRSARKAATARTQFLAAGATFQLADISAREFESIRLVLPLEKSLTRKQKAMKKAIDAYSEAAKYGAAEYTTASTFRIAEVYRQLGSDMLASERPKELNELEREQYDILLEEEAFPFEEKAIEIHLINTARTKEGLYDKWIKQTYDALAALLPARYAKREEGEVGFAQTP